MRKRMLPYGKQWIDEDDVQSVVDVLESDWLTTGPKILEFEQVFSETVNAKHAVAVSNGTAALHTAVHSIGIEHGDEVIVPAITFAATANCVIYQGATPVFADVLPDTLLIDPEKIDKSITDRTKAVIAVDYAGQPCNYNSIQSIADEYNLIVIDDASHSLGGSYNNSAVGSIAALNTFSLHPVKNITTGEGGVITTDDEDLALKMRAFRNHGITSDHNTRNRSDTWFYEMEDLGYNYRITDFQCALGISQIKKLSKWITRRQFIANKYRSAFLDLLMVEPLTINTNISHAFHIYVVKLNLELLKCNRGTIFKALRREGIGVNVHYIPVYLHPYYRKKFNYKSGICSIAEEAYKQIISLPIFPQMSDNDVNDVIEAVFKVMEIYSK